MDEESDLRHSVLVLSDLAHNDLAEYARHVERSGFHGLWYADERFFHEPYVGLSVIAGATETITIGPGVTDPKSRHPALTAAAMNSLSEMSNGRAVLGIGAGNSGFAKMGLTRDRSAQAIREAVVAVRSLLSGDTVSLDGEVVYLDEAQMRVPVSPVRICVAANGPMTLRVAGEVADAVMIPHCRSVDLLRYKVEQVIEGAERSGRNTLPEIVLRLDTSISEDREAALHTAKTRLGRTLWAAYPEIDYLDVLGLGLPAELDRRLRDAGPFPYTFDLSAYEQFADAIPDELLEPKCLAGTSTEVGEQVAALGSAGVAEITILPVPVPGSTERDVVDLYARGLDLRFRS